MVSSSVCSLAGRYDNPIWRTGYPGYIGCMAESIPSNRFLVSLNVYMFVLRVRFCILDECEWDELPDLLQLQPEHRLLLRLLNNQQCRDCQGMLSTALYTVKRCDGKARQADKLNE
jgi:hypothetical protein